jgi:trimeric autotransporter adhesin
MSLHIDFLLGSTHTNTIRWSFRTFNSILILLCTCTLATKRIRSPPFTVNLTASNSRGAASTGVMVESIATSARLRDSNDVIPERFLLQTASSIIYALAGTGTAGYNGALDAKAAEMSCPSGIAINANTGSIYVADTLNNRVQMVKRSTGAIFLVAGNGMAGFSGDGGLATAATMSDPTSVAVDGSNNIYIADSRNNCIRMIKESSGIITTVAGTGNDSYTGDGGLATVAALNSPTGISFDPLSGNLFVADSDNNRIRMITMSTGVITTVAGTGVAGYSGDGGPATSAHLSYPTRMTVDALGNLYIADESNNRVRKITMSTGTISTVAGTGVVGNSGDGGLAQVCRLFKPSDVAVDVQGNIYIADLFNSRIRMVDASTGIINTVAGSGVAGYGGDRGSAIAAELFRPVAIALHKNSELYIADSYNNRVRMLLLSTAPSSSPTSSQVITIGIQEV